MNENFEDDGDRLYFFGSEIIDKKCLKSIKIKSVNVKLSF